MLVLYLAPVAVNDKGFSFCLFKDVGVNVIEFRDRERFTCPYLQRLSGPKKHESQYFSAFTAYFLI